MTRSYPLAAVCAAFLSMTIPAATPAFAGSTAEDGFRWMSDNTEVLREGIIWNDRFGDGKDRYKTGGVTQSWLIPERRLSDERWLNNHASALELQLRGFVATPDNTQTGGAPGDRPFAQFAGIGGYLRTVERPRRVGPRMTQQLETRVGIEIGYQGEPLPFFELQEALHGGEDLRITPNNSIDGEVLVNLEGKRTLRMQLDFSDSDLELAPYLQVSAGMREVSFRAGGDLIYGSSLDGWTWNHDPAIGALIPGGSMSSGQSRWAVWIGADAGYVGADAILEGGFDGSGPRVEREDLTARFRSGILLGFGDMAVSYSITWLSPEFRAQTQGQVIGALSFKYDW